MKEIRVEKTASRGIAVAKAYLYREPDLTASEYAVSEEKTAEEIALFENVRREVIQELEVLAVENEIFAAHLEIAGDFMLQEGIQAKIKEEKKNTQMAVAETIEAFAAIFAGMDDAYMKEREADIRDIGKRFMAKLKGVKLPDLGSIREPVIVVARDFYPSDTVKMNSAYIAGILTEEGGVTSHVSILAKSMNIPALVGVKGILDQVKEQQLLCMDAEAGIILLDPDESAAAQYQEKKEAEAKKRSKLEALRGKEAVTKSGKRIRLCANVGKVEDIKQALPMQIDGVGLFRSEFLYMENNHFPKEEEQFQVYKAAAELVPQELTIRTLDIGGDKALSYFSFEKEENPFLGWRAIRISLDMKEMFKEQLKAILRASAYGNVRIMFPMLISLEELREAKEVLEECRRELDFAGTPYDAQIMVGMMMETPASVFLAEEFAEEVDFFSIGTNDLTQYLLAVDRGNQKIADKYDYFHPAVLKAIQIIIDGGHKAGIPVGMCGEMAGDSKAVHKLLEMGLDEFSMSSGSVDYVRAEILDFEG